MHRLKQLRAGWVYIFTAVFGIGALEFARAEDPKFYAVMVSADVQNSPPRIALRWSADERATGYTIYRRDGASWRAQASLNGSTTRWVDSNVGDGGVYEYCVTKTTSSNYRGTGFVLAGINAPLTDVRGKIVLLVDKTHAAELAAELRRLEWDLAGDGWTVLRHDVSRSDSVAAVKNIIKADYASDPAKVKSVFIFGHVPVPYSGNFNPDGHGDHLGAWAADLYYGDMDGSWTDSSVNSASAEKPWNRNVPGDGKFDQSTLPGNVELAVGRVDFFNMTCYANKTPSRSELDLLRAYLNKDHDFRHRVFTVARRGLVCDNFGDIYGEAFAANGWRNFGTFFGAENVTAVGYGGYFPTLASEDYLWSYGAGGGTWTACNGIGGSDDFARTEIRTVFTMFLGSYFGDWDNESAFLRAPLGSGYCLTTSWAGRPHWFYHSMGLGETIGSSTIASQNNVYGAMYQSVNSNPRGVHVALLGDPTLRMHPVIPPANPRGSLNGASLALSWDASSDSDLRGYHVYRGFGPNSEFTRLTAAPITATSYTDDSYTSGATYMVRAVKLETSGGGTYFNASQGVFYPENGGGGGGIPEDPPSEPPSASAVFAGQDARTQGDWKGVYGAAGYNVISDENAYPGSVLVSASGKQDYQWSGNTADPRALLKASGSGRVAGCWYSPASFTVDLDFLDGATHKLSLYFLDWDRNGRSQQVEIFDAATGAPLDRRSVANFSEGVYLSWNVRGAIRARLTRSTGLNAVLMGMFFDPPGSDPASGTAAAGGMIAGNFQLRLAGTVGQAFEIYASSDLANWTRISTIVLTQPMLNFTDTSSSGKAMRFYRAAAVP